MRILQVVHALPPDAYGGTELYTARIAAKLAARGHEVAVASPRGGADLDVPVFDLAEPPVADVKNDDGLPNGPISPTVDAQFEAVLARFEPDVVHLQHFKGLSAAIPRICAEREIACLATLHDFWALCHREQLYRPDGSRCVGPESTAKCTDCYIAATRNGSSRTVIRDDARSDGSPTARRIDGGSVADSVRDRYAAVVERRTAHLRRALAATDLLVSPSAFLRDLFIEYGTPPADIVQRRNGIRVDRFEDTGFDGAPVRVGYAGRIAPEKGVHLLIEAFDHLRGDATLEIFGLFAPDEDDYHARLAERSGERINFHGWYDDPAAPYRAMDVLVLPSVWYENSPLVIQEAYASGVPVVAADVGGMAELVSDGVDGLTFSVGDAAALGDVLAGLVADPETVERLRDGVRPPKRLGDHVTDLSALYSDCLER